MSAMTLSMLTGCGSDSGNAERGRERRGGNVCGRGIPARRLRTETVISIKKDIRSANETITVAVAGTYDGGKDWNETTMVQEIEKALRH